MSLTKCYIGSISTALPPKSITQKESKEFLLKNYADRLSPKNISVMHKVFNHPSVKQRHFAFNNAEDLVDEDPDKRIERFTHWAVELASQAAASALKEAGVASGDVSALVVNTCTGYLCPGISTYLIESLGLKKSIYAYDLVGSGCGGAIPNLQVCQGLLQNPSYDMVLSISVEICSCTFQMGDDPSLIISNALFGDSAAAAVIGNKPRGFELIDSISHYAPEHRNDIRYVYKKGQLTNQLSMKLPLIAAQKAGHVVHELLKKHNLKTDDITCWALHSGGANVLEKMKQEIGLTDENLAYTRTVLERYGNLSSPTVWFVLKSIQKAGVNAGDRILMLSFGAGLSVHAFFLKAY